MGTHKTATRRRFETRFGNWLWLLWDIRLSFKIMGWGSNLWSKLSCIDWLKQLKIFMTIEDKKFHDKIQRFNKEIWEICHDFSLYCALFNFSPIYLFSIKYFTRKYEFVSTCFNSLSVHDFNIFQTSFKLWKRLKLRCEKSVKWEMTLNEEFGIY